MVYVSFDGDNDIHYYRLLQAWDKNKNLPFEFNDAHGLNFARDSSQESSIKRQLQERLHNSKILIVLIGEKTKYLYKFVRWEIEYGLIYKLPIIAVNLNGSKDFDRILCPPILKEELSIHISFNLPIIKFALENWPTESKNLRNNNFTGPHVYNRSLYKELGLW